MWYKGWNPKCDKYKACILSPSYTPVPKYLMHRIYKQYKLMSKADNKYTYFSRFL